MKQKHQQKFSSNFNQVPKSFIREILNLAGKENMVSFAGGLPNPDFFPVEELERSATEVLTKQGKEVLQYAGSQGYLPLREWIANRYSSRYQLTIDPNNVVITNGSQQTIDVVAKMFINQGDGVIVESPTYLGGIQALSAYNPKFLEAGLMFDGPDMEQLALLCAEQAPKLMYGIPNFQNPSGLCYSNAKKESVAALLRSFDVLMLEDDPYNEIRFEGVDSKPVYAYAPEQVFWSGSFSKMVAPGLRMGWAIVPDGLAPDFIRAKQSTDLHSNNLSQYILYHYLANNDIDQHLNKIKQAYKQQRDCMLEMIEKYFPDEVSYNVPQGGMFVWLTLPDWLDSEELIKRTMNRGVVFVPGKSFFVSHGGKQHIRMNFSNACSADIEKGVSIMAEEMKRIVVLSR